MGAKSHPAGPVNSSKLSNFDQTAICLLDILPLTLAVCLRPEGGDIMTCRVARLSQDILRVGLVFCCECGSADLEMCHTSKALGPHLCQICAQSMVAYGASKETWTDSPIWEQPVA